MEPKPFSENAPSTRRQAQFAFAVALLCAPSFALPALGLMAEFADGPLLDQIFSLVFLAMLLGVVSPIPALVALFLVLRAVARGTLATRTVTAVLVTLVATGAAQYFIWGMFRLW